MSVQDKAHELATAMKESTEFVEFKEVSQQIEGEPEAKKMMEDFQALQSELQQKMMGGEQPSEEEMKKIESMYQVIQMNPTIAKMFDAEKQLSVVVEDVNKIISEALQDAKS